MVSTITERASDFTSRDFDSWIIELRKNASAALPQWTDFNTANFGNILLELFAHTLDVLSYTQDQQHKERYIRYARLKRSMINLGANVGFSLPGSSAASVDLEITIADGLPRVTDIVIPKGTVIRTIELSEEIEFDLIADVTIPAGQIQVTTAQAENARERVNNYVADGSANQEFVLPQTPFVDSFDPDVVLNSVTVFTRVSSFYSSGPADNHYIVTIDQNDRATVIFGDGINGAIPTGTLEITYKTGGGEDGNVEANSLTVFRDGDRFSDDQGNDVRLTVRNPSEASGGVDAMSVEEARVAIPESLVTVGERSVTRDDFEINARKVRGVSRSLMATSNEIPAIPENQGRLYIIPVGGGLPSAALKTEVEDFINNEAPPTLTFSFTVLDPLIRVIDIEAEVYLNIGVTEAEARAAIEESLDAFFALNNEDGSLNELIDFGIKLKDRDPGSPLFGELPWSDIFNAIRDATNAAGNLVLRKVEEDSVVPADDVAIGDIEFPVLGAITLTNGDTATQF